MDMLRHMADQLLAFLIASGSLKTYGFSFDGTYCYQNIWEKKEYIHLTILQVFYGDISKCTVNLPTESIFLAKCKD